MVIGILSDDTNFFNEIHTFFLDKDIDLDLIPVHEKRQTEVLDGILIYLKEDKSSIVSVEWLLHLQTNPQVFVWIVTSVEEKSKRRVYYELGANEIVDYRYLDELPYIFKNRLKYSKKKMSTILKSNEDKFLNSYNHSIFIDDEEIFLTNIEFNLLLLLSDNENSTVTYEKIGQNIWGGEILDREEVRARIANVVFRLRNKVKNNKNIEIKTTRGVGYLYKSKGSTVYKK